MTRAEHLAWCKQRALEYVDSDPGMALASMISDLGKHPDTARLVEPCHLGLMDVDSPSRMRGFIEGFN